MAKVTDYLLNPLHPVGAAKAKFFLGLGFARDAPKVLRSALLAHPETNDVLRQTAAGSAVKFVVQCALSTPDGRNPCIRSVWMRSPDEDGPRLITAYPFD